MEDTDYISLANLLTIYYISTATIKASSITFVLFLDTMIPVCCDITKYPRITLYINSCEMAIIKDGISFLIHPPNLNDNRLQFPDQGTQPNNDETKLFFNEIP